MNLLAKCCAVVGALGLGLMGCGTDKGARKDGTPSEMEVLSENISQEKRGDEKITEFDLNHDQRPDVWSFSVASKTPEGKDIDKLVRKELDINWDSKVDITRTYGDNEAIDKEALDLDFDGKVDQRNYYEKGVIVRKDRDLDYNGKPDLWIYFEKGKIERKERDTNGDSKVDYWEYWEGDHVDRIGEDSDGDGNVDRWTKNPNAETTEPGAR
ncbi:MAG: hypothetical protein ACT4TC_13875 [Myxococcaceae bacterium]